MADLLLTSSVLGTSGFWSSMLRTWKSYLHPHPTPPKKGEQKENQHFLDPSESEGAAPSTALKRKTGGPKAPRWPHLTLAGLPPGPSRGSDSWLEGRSDTSFRD